MLPGVQLIFLSEHAHLSNDITLVEIGDDHLSPVVILDHDGDRAADDVVQRIAAVTGIDDGALGRIAAPVAMAEKLVDLLDLWSKRKRSNQRLVPPVRGCCGTGRCGGSAERRW